MQVIILSNWENIEAKTNGPTYRSLFHVYQLRYYLFSSSMVTDHIFYKTDFVLLCLFNVVVVLPLTSHSSQSNLT